MNTDLTRFYQDELAAKQDAYQRLVAQCVTEGEGPAAPPPQCQFELLERVRQGDRQGAHTSKNAKRLGIAKLSRKYRLDRTKRAIRYIDWHRRRADARRLLQEIIDLQRCLDRQQVGLRTWRPACVEPCLLMAGAATLARRTC
jgi:hypothetical protein